MGKHKTVNQDKIFVGFMAQHPSLARGFCKGEKTNQEEKWTELTDKLNEVGPPFKDITSWKKTWIDWRLHIQKKISHNKSELTGIEKEIAVICNFIKNVDGIKQEKSDDISSTSSSRTFSVKLSPHPSKKRKTDSNLHTFDEITAQHLESFRNGEEKSVVSSAVGDLAKKLDSIDRKLNEMGRKYDVLIELKKEQIDEMKKDRQERRRHNLEIEEYNNLMLGKYSYRD